MPQLLQAKPDSGRRPVTGARDAALRGAAA